jgi:spectinomycin phosphotransferase
VAPDGIDECQLSRVVADHWGLVPARLQYLPVGFGDHHWELTDSAGRRWFVTVAGLAGSWRGTGSAAGYADLRAAMETVTALAGAGLEFALAPVPTTGGQALAPLGGEHAITVFPYIDGAGEDVGDEISGRGWMTLIDMLARLHNATPQAAFTHRSSM